MSGVLTNERPSFQRRLQAQHKREHDHAMADEPENLTIRLLQEIRSEMRDGFAEVGRRFDKLETHVTASDDENAKVLDKILQHTASINEVLIDLQARVMRNEKRVKAIEERRPEA